MPSHQPLQLDLRRLLAAAADPIEAESIAGHDVPLVFVDAERDPVALSDDAATKALRCLPAVIVAVGGSDAHPAWADLTIARNDTAGNDTAGTDDLLDSVASTVALNPRAATAFALLLRGSERWDPHVGLINESATYSMLQSAEEFHRWRARTPVRPPGPVPQSPVRMERIDDDLHITLDHPARHNSFSRAMRDALCEALSLAIVDDSIASLVLTGSGRSFCSGGDLDEFGQAGDPAAAHHVRLTRSAGWLLHLLADRTSVSLHGSCIGSGIELAAFAGHVAADPETSIRLPEVGFGLIPGAGGCVSLPARIGRHRTCQLGLSGRSIGANTALDWGLIDEIGSIRPALLD